MQEDEDELMTPAAVLPPAATATMTKRMTSWRRRSARCLRKRAPEDVVAVVVFVAGFVVAVVVVVSVVVGIVIVVVVDVVIHLCIFADHRFCHCCCCC